MQIDEKCSTDHLVSVIVPVFNAADSIPECINNLTNQTYQNIEIILIVDKKSTDDSIKVANYYSSNKTNIFTFIQTDNDRMSGARNIGINESKGDVICFLDVDDYQYPSFIEELLSIMDFYNADMVFCNHYQETKKIIPAIPDKEYNVTIYDEKTAVGAFTELPVYPWSRIQKKQLFYGNDLTFYNHLSAEDVEQTIRSLVASNRVCFYDKPLSVYYKLGHSATNRHRIDDAKSMENIARRVVPLVKNNCPIQYSLFITRMLERLMRQMAFVKYRDYCRIYNKSIAHTILQEITNKTIEMKVFSHSKFLYYVILYRYTHGKWDNKTGLWK